MRFARYNGVACLSVFVLFVPPGFLLLLTFFLNGNSHMPNDDWTFHSDMDRLTRGFKMYMKRPRVVGFSLTCPTSQCGSQPASAYVMQFSVKTVFDKADCFFSHSSHG